LVEHSDLIQFVRKRFCNLYQLNPFYHIIIELLLAPSIHHQSTEPLNSNSARSTNEPSGVIWKRPLCLCTGARIRVTTLATGQQPVLCSYFPALVSFGTFFPDASLGGKRQLNYNDMTGTEKNLAALALILTGIEENVHAFSARASNG
jgi:hypothetical protein